MQGDTPNRGFTLVEVVIAMTVLAVVFAIIYAGMIQTTHVVNIESTILEMDLQGNKALQEVSDAIRPAILPIAVPRGTGSASPRGFNRLDDPATGFGGANGQAWLTALQEGMDCIAFVVPVDEGRDGDIFDDELNLETGVIRFDGRHVSGSVYTYSASGGISVSNTEQVSALTAMIPGNPKSNQASNGLVGEVRPRMVNWNNTQVTSSTSPASMFTVVRFVQSQEANGDPITVSESNLRTDLDGDGLQSTVFEIGSLEIINSGGGYYSVSDSRVITPSPGGMPPVLPQETRPLTGPYLLRDHNPANRMPIFRLVGYNPANLSAAGGVIPVDSPGGSLALLVRLWLYDPTGQNNATIGSNRPIKAITRQFETVVELKNMVRD